MTHLTLQQWLPLGTAMVWFGLAVYQVARDRYRTWTEVFFLAACFFTGAYALSDLFFFNVETKSQATIAALASFTFISLTAMFYMLFGVVFYTRMRKILFLTLVPGLLLLPYMWLNLVVGLEGLEPGGQPPYVGEWDVTTYLLWAAFILAYAIVGSLAFFLTYREVGRYTPKLRGRMQGLMLSFILMIVLGSSTNMIRGAVGFKILPLFSTALVLPGIVAFLTLSPMSKERMSVAVRRWKARKYDIKAAFLIYDDGTLIGAKVKPGETMIDQDLFSGTLDVIQNFMRTSFPGLRGKWLRSITHGDYTLVMEYVRRVSLTLVLSGEETDQLRRQMRDLLRTYEETNREVLGQWKGLPEEATGTDVLLEEFFIEPTVDVTDRLVRAAGSGDGIAAEAGRKG